MSKNVPAAEKLLAVWPIRPEAGRLGKIVSSERLARFVARLPFGDLVFAGLCDLWTLRVYRNEFPRKDILSGSPESLFSFYFSTNALRMALVVRIVRRLVSRCRRFVLRATSDAFSSPSYLAYRYTFRTSYPFTGLELGRVRSIVAIPKNVSFLNRLFRAQIRPRSRN